MRTEIVNCIEIDGFDNVILCDIAILCEIQEKYGSIKDFEKKLLDCKIVPDFELLDFIIKKMTDEAGRYLNIFVRGRNFTDPLGRIGGMTINELVDILHNEIEQCFFSRRSYRTDGPVEDDPQIDFDQVLFIGTKHLGFSKNEVEFMRFGKFCDMMQVCTEFHAGKNFKKTEKTSSFMEL